MKVICQESPGKAVGSGGNVALWKALDKPSLVIVVEKDVSFVDAANHHVLKNICDINSA